MNILIIGNETAFKQNLLAVIADKTHWQVKTLETGSPVLKKDNLLLMIVLLSLILEHLAC